MDRKLNIAIKALDQICAYCQTGWPKKDIGDIAKNALHAIQPKKGYNPLKYFDFFWNKYKKKIDHKKCKAKFSKLKESDVNKISSTVEDYVLAHPDKKFRKNPLTYLNGECWNDEIENDSTPKVDKEAELERFRKIKTKDLKLMSATGNIYAFEILRERGKAID